MIITNSRVHFYDLIFFSYANFKYQKDFRYPISKVFLIILFNLFRLT